MTVTTDTGNAGKSRLPFLLIVLFLTALAYWWLGDGKLFDFWPSSQKTDPGSALQRGRMYAEGLLVEQDWERAVMWYRKAAKEGNPQGEYQLGRLYEEGNGVAQNWVQAAGWYRKAAEQGLADGAWRLGLCYRDGHGVGQDPIWAQIWLGKAAMQRHPEAREALATMRAGRAEDTVGKTMEAAEAGDAAAQRKLGDRYMSGNGVKKDVATGADWYRKAAEQGNAEAQCQFGNCLRTGHGVEKDAAEAEKWFRAAAEQGNAVGQRLLGKSRMAAGDPQESARWLQKAAEGGDAEGQYLLARCHQNGLGTTRDPELAQMWLEAAAKNGHAAAQSAWKAQKKAGDKKSQRGQRGARKGQSETETIPTEPEKTGTGAGWLQKAAAGLEGAVAGCWPENRLPRARAWVDARLKRMSGFAGGGNERDGDAQTRDDWDRELPIWHVGDEVALEKTNGAVLAGVLARLGDGTASVETEAGERVVKMENLSGRSRVRVDVSFREEMIRMRSGR